jgi:large subunit ribosomal protein L3
MTAILAKKLGMTQRFSDDGHVERVTVLEAGPCPVLAVRTADADGYEAVQLGFGAVREKALSKGELGHLKKADAPPLRTVKEFRDHAGELTIGDTVTVEAFEIGQKVKISGTSKGKGFQGTIKRHNFAAGPKSHGSHNVRAPGSIGASATPSRVFKGIKGPGRMGGGRVTQLGLTIVELIPDQNLMLVRGSVPGPKGGTVEVRTDG